MSVQIRETKVDETGDGTGVRLIVSDMPLHADGASFRMDLFVTLPAYKTPLLAQIQRQAVLRAMESLRGLESQLLQTFPQGARPEPDTR
jgi:hypothetical protein